jgi:hypothetical protein
VTQIASSLLMLPAAIVLPRRVEVLFVAALALAAAVRHGVRPLRDRLRAGRPEPQDHAAMIEAFTRQGSGRLW